MKKLLVILCLAVTASVVLGACASKPYTCTDPGGCVMVGNGASIKIASLLTMSGPNAVYGIDSMRGVEIAISDKKQVSGHSIELIKADELCSAEGGKKGATELAANADLVGVIGTTCSSASVPAAEILTKANMVLISPASTAPSLTEPATHQAGFLRAIYNDKAQGKTIAEFAFSVLGTRRMVTFHDGTAYPKQLQQAACDAFKQMGGACLLQVDLSTNSNIFQALQTVAPQNPDVIYFPVYTDDGVAIRNAISQAGLADPALLSSDGLLSTDFLQKVGASAEGMYLSGPVTSTEPVDFLNKYKARYGEDPIATYHLQGYDAAMMLFAAIQKVAIPVSSGGNGISIPRQALREALFATHGMQGLSGPINCSPTGDCAQPNIAIFQVIDGAFKPIFP